MMLAVDAQGKKITTVEGLAANGKLTPLQEAFIEYDALQCGFCTPGFLMSLTALLAKNANPTDHDIKEAVSGNICRCGTYVNMFAAVKAAAANSNGGKPKALNDRGYSVSEEVSRNA